MTLRKSKPADRPASNADCEQPRPAQQGSITGLPPGIFLFLAIAGFYIWTATSSQYAFAWGTKKQDHYNLLTEGFLSGHLYLALEPPKELLALKDPLDPVANAPYRLHDASLYKGHYYVYFGPVPVLTLYLPWRVITGWSIPNNLAVILYLLAGFIFSCLLLFRLTAACCMQLSWLQKRLAIAALGLCQTAPIVLRRAFMYEAAVTAGLCFAIAALYFLARYVLDEHPKAWHAVLAGLFLGFTPGCRPNYLILVTVVGAGYLLYLYKSRCLRGRELIRELCLVGTPLALCGLLLLWYNYARFGNPLDVGQRYQLIGDLADRGLTTKISNLLPGLYRLLLQPPIWVRHFPFFELATSGPLGSDVWEPGNVGGEPLCGILAISPLCIAGLGVPLLLRRFREQLVGPVRIVLWSAFAAALFNLLAVVMTVNHVSQRYEMDFAPEMLVIAVFLLLYWTCRTHKAIIRWILRIVLDAGLVVGAGLQACLSINSYENALIERDPATFYSLSSLFGATEYTARRPVYGLAMKGEITFHHQPAGRREALITTGVPHRSNAVFVEYLDSDRIRFASYTTGHTTVYGPPVSAATDKPHNISVGYVGGDRKLTVKLDDATALDVDTFFYPTAFSDAEVLKNDFGMPPNLEPFSGELNAPRGLEFATTSR